VALDADTGKLRWHYQFTPNDSHDWDSVHVPVLADLTIDQQNRKVVMMGNRNGFFYVLDRATGKLLIGKPFTETKWAKAIGADGRPIVLNESGTSEECLPDMRGSTNFMPPSYDPARGLFFLNALETCAVYYPMDEKVRMGQRYVAGAVQRVRDSYGALRAI